MLGIWLTLFKVVSRCLAARDDGLGNQVGFFLNEWHQVGVVVESDHEHTLPRILCLIRAGPNVRFKRICPGTPGQIRLKAESG